MHRPRRNGQASGAGARARGGAWLWACGALLLGAAAWGQDARLVLYSEFSAVPAKRFKLIPLNAVPEGPRVDGVAKPGSPKIDGELSDAAWARCIAVELDSEMGATAAAEERVRQTTARICRDGETLYAAFQCREPAIGEVPVGAEGTADGLCAENVRLFIAPAESGGDFFIFGADANGARHESSLRAGAAWAPEWEVKCLRTPEGWTAEMAIPFKSLGITRELGRETWRVNFTRCVAVTNERLSWEATRGNPMNPEQWGMLSLGEMDALRRTMPPPRLSLYPDRWLVRSDERVLRVVARADFAGSDLAKMKLRLSAFAEGKTEAAAVSTLPMRGERAYLVLGTEALPAGAFDLTAELLDAAEAVTAKAKVALRRDLSPVPPATPGKIEVRVPGYGFKGRAAANWPINTGVALPKGAIFSAQNCKLTDAAGAEVPCAAQVRSRWPVDGSVRWLGLEFRANVTRPQPESLFLHYGPDVVRAPAKGFTMEVQKNVYEALNMYLMEMEDAWWVNTGQILFNIKKRFAGVEDVAVDVNQNGVYDWTEQILGMPPNRAGGPYVTDEGGRTYRLSADPKLKIQVEDFHEQRIVLRGEGRLMSVEKGDDAAMGSCVFRVFAYAGQPFIRLQVTFFLEGRALRGRIVDLGVAERLDNDMRKHKHDAFFGVPEGFRQSARDGGGLSMLRLRGDEYVIQNVREPVTVNKRGGGALNWAGAVGPDRGVAVCLKNMGALYPKEFQFAADGRMVTHFWPPHGGEELRAMPGPVDSRNAGLLGFAHHGRLLNLKAPAEFAGGIKERATLPDFEGVRSIDLAEPGGMALTYDLLYVFFRGEPDLTEIAEISRIFEQSPHATQNHASLAASEVLPDMLPPGRAERATRLVQRMLALEEARGPALGDFNFMDLRRDWRAREGRWTLTDYWMGPRADIGAALWTLYLQTGRPELFTAAERHTRHVVSVDLCRSAEEADALQADPRRRRIAGAFGDHRTPAHWQGAYHVSDRYARIRELMLAYYLTGDSLARDSAFAWAEAARRHGIPFADYDGMVYLNNLADVLGQFYDPALHDRMGECADLFFAVSAGAPGDEVWTPGLRAYARKTGDPRAARAVTAAAASARRDDFLLIGLLRDLEDAAGQTEAGRQAQALAAAFEKRADALLAHKVAVNDSLTWPEVSAYIFGATERSDRFAPKVEAPPPAAGK